ncbi:MAG: hypothetical protein DMG54_35345 [Acidobacteria bacterium]|nr:MAG: hypothetical protein DMG54_35345 [Acidobacteriota bacterium]
MGEITIRQPHANGNVLGFLVAGNATSAAWTLQSATYTVPAGGAAVRLYAQIYQPTGLTTARFDDGFLTGASGLGPRYYFADHLGSTRLVTGTTNPSAPLDSLDYGPFGEQMAGDTATHYKFAGKERDSESGLDNFGKRYFGSAMGRFMQPDPLLNSGQPWNPQSWNRYAYTENNPLRYTDPTGLYKFGDCSGTAEQCLAQERRFRDSISKAKEALKGLDPKSKEAKALQKTLNKLGDEDEGNIKINFGDAGTTNGMPNLGKTLGHNITINYDAVDSEAKDFNLNASETAALDAGVTTHEGTHALGNGLLGVF